MAYTPSLTPFTYEHFTQAINSLKDDLLMYYIDEAVGIYCRLRNINVGARPASAKDYSPQYADAFEAANYAVYKVATKIHSYNPKEGDFKKYLNAALKTALIDILKEDGRGDFFDQTSKKKNKEDEPEKHYRVDIDRYWGSTESEPGDEATAREERIQKHKDEALEVMINYIDSLPDIKRAAIYASAFGQVLRPDLEGYGRNYADILAKVYNTTSLYIRQLATEGKKAALTEARRQGFSERSMQEIIIGFMQARTPILDINDKVIKASSNLTPYQQFILLRHLAGKL